MAWERASILNRLAWLCRVPAVIFATLLLIAGACFGSTHDFGAFLLSMPVLAILFIAALVATIWAACIKALRGRALAALALICLTPLVYLCAYKAAQEVRFLIWAPAHYAQLARASGRDGIIMGWDSWGFGGEDTSSYLVVDTLDALGSKSRAEQWTRHVGQTCGLWQAQKVWPRVYVVTTYTNCPYDGVEPAG